jgi:hypothetical protein
LILYLGFETINQYPQNTKTLKPMGMGMGMGLGIDPFSYLSCRFQRANLEYKYTHFIFYL